MSVRWPFVKMRLFSTCAADMFWFRAFNRQAKAIPMAGIFLANVFRTFLEVATLVQATVTAILCRIGAFSLTSSSTNFSHEKLESCSTVFCVAWTVCLACTDFHIHHPDFLPILQKQISLFLDPALVQLQPLHQTLQQWPLLKIFCFPLQNMVSFHSSCTLLSGMRSLDHHPHNMKQVLVVFAQWMAGLW